MLFDFIPPKIFLSLQLLTRIYILYLFQILNLFKKDPIKLKFCINNMGPNQYGTNKSVFSSSFKFQLMTT